MEFIAVLEQSQVNDRWSFISAICEYFYKERTFYANLLEFDGQNSFRQYFQHFVFQSMEPMLLPETQEIITAGNLGELVSDETLDFFTHFISDAILMSIFRWITGAAKIPADQFVTKLKEVESLLIHAGRQRRCHRSASHT